MNITIGSKITINEPSKEIIEWAYENLVFANPQYEQNKALGYSNYKTPKEIFLFQSYGNKITMPFGVYKHIWKYVKGEPYTINFKPIETRKLSSDIELREYQKNAIESVLKAKNGVLVAPCGSGKTLMGLYIANSLHQKTLWIAHTLDLVNQAKNVFEKTFKGLQEGDVGTITEGKVNIGNIITFATVQTLSNLDLTDYEYVWNTIITDECHHIANKPNTLTMYDYVMNRLCARYKIGLTATPKRRDGLTLSMYAILGEKIFEITDCQVKLNKVPATLRVIDLPTQESLDYLESDYKFNNTKFSEYIANLGSRNASICNEIIKLFKEKRKQLVLCERISQVEKIFAKLNYFEKTNELGIKMAVFTGGIKRSQREHILRNYKDYDVIIATYQIASEGLDMPALDTLHLASPKTKNNKALIKQCVGRIERASEGKDSSEVIFYRDTNILFSRRACENVRLAMGIKKRDYLF